MRWFVDSSVWLTALGAAHPDKSACRDFLGTARDASIEMHVNTEIAQEIVFHRLRRTGRAGAVGETRAAMSQSVVHPVDLDTIELALTLIESTDLRGRDAVHVASARMAGFAQIVSLDRDFDSIPGLVRVHPGDARAG